jgi:hypothetical protein
MISLFLVDEVCSVRRKSCLDKFREHATHCRELSNFKYIGDFVREALFDVFKHTWVSVKKDAFVNFLTDPLEGRSTLRSIIVLVYGWVWGKHACVDLIEFIHLWDWRLRILLYDRLSSKLLQAKCPNMRKRVLTINMFSYHLFLTLLVSWHQMLWIFWKKFKKSCITMWYLLGL